jgi:hypothetical protein
LTNEIRNRTPIRTKHCGRNERQANPPLNTVATVASRSSDLTTRHRFGFGWRLHLKIDESRKDARSLLDAFPMDETAGHGTDLDVGRTPARGLVKSERRFVAADSDSPNPAFSLPVAHRIVVRRMFNPNAVH